MTFVISAHYKIYIYWNIHFTTSRVSNITRCHFLRHRHTTDVSILHTIYQFYSQNLSCFQLSGTPQSQLIGTMWDFVFNIVGVQGRIQDFKLGEGALKKNCAERRVARTFLGYFVWKITILLQKNHIFFNFRGGGPESAPGVKQVNGFPIPIPPLPAIEI